MGNAVVSQWRKRVQRIMYAGDTELVLRKTSRLQEDVTYPLPEKAGAGPLTDDIITIMSLSRVYSKFKALAADIDYPI